METENKAISQTSKRLTLKEERFCREYLLDFNATQAAIRAGYSIKTAYSIGQRLLKKPDISKLIENLVSNQIYDQNAIKGNNPLVPFEGMNGDMKINKLKKISLLFSC